MKLIDVSTKRHPNVFAMVDDDDFDRVNQWKWSATRASRGPNLYARRAERVNGKSRGVAMHHEILGRCPGMEVDHKDGNGLNNQRQNLRFATHAQNTANKIKRKAEGASSSKFKGVTWSSRRNAWLAQIGIGGRQKVLGAFAAEEDAARLYDAVAAHHFGEFANLNFPEKACECPSQFREINLRRYNGGGVDFRHGIFRARYRGLHIGHFTSREAALAAIASVKNKETQ